MSEENKDENPLAPKTEEENKEEKPSEEEGGENPPEKGEKEEKKEEEEIDEEPKKRFPKEKEDSRLGYRYRQLEKENKRLRELSGGADTDNEDDEDSKPITRRELKDMLDQNKKELSSETMLQQFLSENPDYRKYEKTMRKYVNDADYSNIPIGFIASGIAGEHLDEEADKRANLKREADNEANRTKSPGSTKRSVPGKKGSVWDMSKEDFEEHQNEVLRNRE